MSDHPILSRYHNSSVITMAFGGKTDINNGNFRYLSLAEKFIFNCIGKRKTLKFFEQKSDMGCAFENQSGSDV